MERENIVGLSNIFADIPAQHTDELCQTILSKPGLRIERIVSRGHCSPEQFWYDQEQHELVMLLAGAARLLFDGDETAKALKPGDILNIPAHRRHRVEWTDPDQPTVWLAIHY